MKGGYLTSSAYTLATLFQDIGTTFTSTLGWLTDIVEWVAATPFFYALFLLVMVKIVMRICRKWLPGI